MEEKMQFIKARLSGEYSMVECCRLFGISRETGYKWWKRFCQGGEFGLQEKSRAAHRHDNAMDGAMAAWLCEIRRKHPKWGPRMILGRLKLKHPDKHFPSPSTVGALFLREGLVRKTKRGARSGDYSSDVGGYYGPNAVWCADFKGQFRCGNGCLCYPLTISDGFSRSLLRCQSLRGTEGSASKKVFESAFREFGLPDAIRTDNGVPFSSVSGVSPLSIWWVKLGITPLRIQPGKPTQNGRHERIHRTMKQDVPIEKNLRAQQRAFDEFTQDYNYHRPHQSLNDQTPAMLYTASTKPYPTKLREPEYEEVATVERVSKAGALKWKEKTIAMTPLLAGEPIGIVLADDDRHQVYYGPILLGVISKKGAFLKGRPKPTRKNSAETNKKPKVSGMPSV